MLLNVPASVNQPSQPSLAPFVTLLLFDHVSLTNPEYTTLPKITDRSHATVTRIQINIVKRSLLTSSGMLNDTT